MGAFDERRDPRSGIGIVIRCPLCGGAVEKHAVKLEEGANFFCNYCNNGTWWHITMLSEAPVEPEPCFQESPSKKAVWLADAEKRMPLGTRVKVIDSDETTYVNTTGKVIGYDVGIDGDWPLVRVEFDSPVNGVQCGRVTHDGFICDGEADDEIVKWSPCECCDSDPCVHADEVPDGWGEP